MIAAEHKTVFDAAQYRLHAATVSFYSRRAWVVKTAPMNRTPKVGIEFEIGAAPFAFHRTKKLFEVPLHFRMCAVEHVPWTTPPPTKCNSIRAQRLSVRVVHKPIRVLLKDLRFLLGDKRRNPDRGFKAALANLFQNALHVAAKRGAGLEPVAHSRLIAVVNLHVTQIRCVFGDEVEIIENLLRGDAWTEAIPRAPAGRRRWKT